MEQETSESQNQGVESSDTQVTQSVPRFKGSKTFAKEYLTNQDGEIFEATVLLENSNKELNKLEKVVGEKHTVDSTVVNVTNIPLDKAIRTSKSKQKLVIDIAPDVLIKKLVRPKVKRLINKAFELADGIKTLKTNKKGEEYIYCVPPSERMILYLLDQYLGKSAQRKDETQEDKEFNVTVDDVSRVKATS